MSDVPEPPSQPPPSLAGGGVSSAQGFEAARRESSHPEDARERMEAVLIATEVGTWTYDILANEVWADANLARMFGVSAKDAAGGSLEAYLSAIHPEDVKRVQETIGDALQRRGKFMSEYRLVQKDGSIIHVLARGIVEADENGQPLRLPGVILDISEKVAAESEKQELAAELERQARTVETVMSSIADFAYTFDAEGRIVYANQALLDLWEMPLKDAEGKTSFELPYPPDVAAVLHLQIRQVFETGQSLSDQMAYTNPKGTTGYYEYILQPVLAADGTVELVAGSTRDITAGRNAMEALRQSEENFRSLAETLPDTVWEAGPQGGLLWANSVLSRITGLSQEKLMEGSYRSLIHPDDLDTTLAAWEAVRDSGGALEALNRIRQADGSWRWHLVRGKAARDETGAVTRWIGTSTDVHEQRELQAKLERSEAQFRQLADTIPQLAWMAHPNGDIYWYNQRWYDYTGTTPEDMKDSGWRKVHDPEILPKVVGDWTRSVEKGEPFDMTFPLRGADGKFRPFLTRAMAFRDEAGEVVLWFGTNTDVSEQRDMMQQREELLASERAARNAAEHASRMKDEFLATLSHELRSPLNAIFGWTQILRESEGDADTITEGLDVVDRNVRSLSQLIADLLDMNRIISGKLRMDVQQVDPNVCIAAAVETVGPAADAKDIRIEMELNPHAGPISGDPGRLQQIIWNLLSNAIKFTPRGGKVQVRVERVNSQVEIRVTDNGQGISADFLPYLFDRFRQADSAMNRKHGGLGLGLAIVKQLVELHGGSIRVESEGEGKGATFVVHLPVKALATVTEDEPMEAAAAKAVSAASWKSEVLAGLRVLVVDDEKDARDLLKRLLEDCGAVVTTAGSAVEALERIRGAVPEFIVSDIGMPRADGYEFMRRLRALPAGEGGAVPAIALTAFARVEDRQKALEAGFKAHVAKPVEPAELIGTIAVLAGRVE